MSVIIGVILGILVLVVIIGVSVGVGIYCCRFRRRKRLYANSIGNISNFPNYGSSSSVQHPMAPPLISPAPPPALPPSAEVVQATPMYPQPIESPAPPMGNPPPPPLAGFPPMTSAEEQPIEASTTQDQSKKISARETQPSKEGIQEGLRQEEQAEEARKEEGKQAMEPLKEEPKKGETKKEATPEGYEVIDQSAMKKLTT